MPAHHDRHPENGPDTLLHEEIERRLDPGAHLDGPHPEDAKSLRQRQHPLLRPPAAVRFDADTGPEALAGQISVAGLDAGHPGRHQEHVDGVRRTDETVGQAVPRSEGDGAPRP